MNKHLIVLLPMLSLAFIGCEKETERRIETKTVENSSTDSLTVEKDKNLMQMVRKAIENSPILSNTQNLDVEITVNDGIVVLKGTVPTQEVKDELGRAIKNIAGVKSYNDEVKINASN